MWTNQLDSLPVAANSNTLAGLVLMHLILIILLYLCQRKRATLLLEEI